MTVIATCALGAPGAALGAPKRPKYLAPPGNSAVSQYLEVVPTAGGSEPPRSGGAGHTPTLSSGQRHVLSRYGGEGRTLIAIVAATAPPTSSRTRPEPNGGRGSRAAARGSGGTSATSSGTSVTPLEHPYAPLVGASTSGTVSPVSAVLAAATGRVDGGGIGILLLLLMGLVLLGTLLGVAKRRRMARRS